MYRIGEKVHAVDELGRWELGRITEIDGDDGRPTVKFVGWEVEFNVKALPDEVRHPVDFQSQSFVGDLPKRKGKKASRPQLALLRHLCRGDHVEVDGHDVEVLQVDQFLRKIKVMDAGSMRDIDVSSIHVTEEAEKEPHQVANTKRARGTQEKRVASVEGCNNREDLEICEEPVSEQKAHKGFFEVPSRNGPIRCGMMCQVLTNLLVVIVKEITFNGEVFFGSCFLVAEGVPAAIERDITLTLPLDRLKPLKDCLPLQRNDKRLMMEIAGKQADSFIVQLREDFSFRRLVRHNILKNLIKKEIASAFKSKNQRKTFSLGVCSPEIDFTVLNLHLVDKKRAVYSYKDNTIHELDAFLDSTWDLGATDGYNYTPFVTQLVFWVRNDCLHGTVYSAIFQGLLDRCHYRKALAIYIKDVQLPLPVDEHCTEERE